MKPFINFFLFMLTVASLAAQPAKIIVFRHAEEAADGSKESLSIRGQERAMALVPMLTQTPELIAGNTPLMLFATKISRHTTNNHTHETLEPLASQLGLKIDAPYANSDYEALARHVLTSATCKEKTILICWTHSGIPGLVAALGVIPEPVPWSKDVYDRLLVVTYDRGTAKMVKLPQKLLFGDRSH
jgi:hypothetical protein